MIPRTIMLKIKAVVQIVVILVISLARAEDEADCFHYENATGGYISSPNYPNDYPNSIECRLNLEANLGERIKLTFHDFHLLESAIRYSWSNVVRECEQFVALYDGSSENDPLLGKFCGNELPPPSVSTNGRMLVVFHASEGIWQTQGFEASYVREFSMKYIPGVTDTQRNLKQLLLGTRQQVSRSIDKWGTRITKTAIALFLNDKEFFSPSNRNGEEIAYELSLRLLTKLAFKKSISTKDLAQYINALTVACFDPKDFFGVNFVKELRKRVNKRSQTHPFSILTLCNSKDAMTMDDVMQLQELFYLNFRPVWTDAQAMVVMALSCIHSETELNLNENILNDMVTELKKKQHKNGTIDNWKTTALVLQALLATGDYRTDFNISAAVKFLLEHVDNHSNINDTYYILPVLNGMSLANINSDHCTTFFQTEGRKSSLDLPIERIQVQISVIAGDNMDFYHTWKVKVPSNYSFYQVLEKIGTMEHSYKAHYSVSDGKPHLVGFANFMDNTEDGSFWYIYTRPLSSSGNLKLIELSPVDIQVSETDEIIIWYRSGFWSNSEEGSGFIHEAELFME